MSEAITINLPKVGDILLERSYRAIHINISVKPSLKVRVAVPVGVTFEKAQHFAEQRADWIIKQLKKFSKSKAKRLLKQPDETKLIAAKKYLIDRVEYFAKMYDFNITNSPLRAWYHDGVVAVGKNNISLNILIAGLPTDIQDYIILHELLHTKIKNHSKNYWEELDRLTGDAKGLHKKLKANYTLYDYSDTNEKVAS